MYLNFIDISAENYEFTIELCGGLGFLTLKYFVVWIY